MKNELNYIQCGDYLIPDIALTCTESIKWNKYSRMAEACLKEHKPMIYEDLVLMERLFPYLNELGKTAIRRVEQLMKELLELNPAPDKSTQQLSWISHMNGLKAQAEEIVYAELIFC